MSFVKRYRLVTSADRQGELVGLVADLVRALQSLQGFEAGQIYTQRDAAGIVHFDEHWSSADAYKLGSPSMPKAVLSTLMGVTVESPTVIDLEGVAA